MRQQSRGDAALGLQQGHRHLGIGRFGDRGIEFFAQRRQRDDHFGAAVDQRGNPLDAAAVGRKALGYAVDHVLLLGSEFQPRLLQDLAERGRGFADLERLAAGVRDEIPRGEPQFVHAAVNVLGQIADALQPLQLAKGRIDVADGDDAGGRRDDDHRQHQHEAAECQLADRKRERSRRRRIQRRFGGHVGRAGLLSGAIYDVFRAVGNMPGTMVKPAEIRSRQCAFPPTTGGEACLRGLYGRLSRRNRHSGDADDDTGEPDPRRRTWLLAEENHAHRDADRDA